MEFVILSRDAADGAARRPAVRDAHLARLRELDAEGRLRLAGPMPRQTDAAPGADGYHGSLIVASFDSEAAARAWADADPYVAAGVYDSVEIYPFKTVFPET